MEPIFLSVDMFNNPASLNSLVNFTFFIGSMAMMAATAFFWLEMRSVDPKWRTSLLISGLITFIAAVPPSINKKWAGKV